MATFTVDAQTLEHLSSTLSPITQQNPPTNGQKSMGRARFSSASSGPVPP